MTSRRNETNRSLVGEMRVGEMRVGEMRVGEMRVGEMRVGEMSLTPHSTCRLHSLLHTVVSQICREAGYQALH